MPMADPRHEHRITWDGRGVLNPAAAGGDLGLGISFGQFSRPCQEGNPAAVLRTPSETKAHGAGISSSIEIRQTSAGDAGPHI